MANIVDAEDFVRKATVVEDGEETTEFASLAEEAEAEAEAPAEEAPEVEEAPTEDDLPEKYQGKSTAEIARMQNEKRLGQQSQEVEGYSSLRRLRPVFHQCSAVICTGSTSRRGH